MIVVHIDETVTFEAQIALLLAETGQSSSSGSLTIQVGEKACAERIYDSTCCIEDLVLRVSHISKVLWLQVLRKGVAVNTRWPQDVANEQLVLDCYHGEH